MRSPAVRTKGPIRAEAFVWPRQPESWSLTVCCKATFELGSDTTLLVVPDPIRWQGNPYLADGSSEAAPLKLRAEVLVRTTPLARAQWVSMSVGSWYKRLLLEPGRAELGLGPRPLVHQARRLGLGEDEIVWACARWMNEPPPSEAAFELFNVAPDDQQLDGIGAGDAVTLYEMHPSRRAWTFRLPMAAPDVTAQLASLGGSVAVPLRCDTLDIDPGREQATMMWRGVLAVPAIDEHDLVMVSLETEASSRPSPRTASPLSSVLPVASSSGSVDDEHTDDTEPEEAMSWTDEDEDDLPLEASRPLESCARTAARLDIEPRRRADALAAESLDEAGWTALDRWWSAALSAELDTGGSALADAYADAYVAELEALRGEVSVEQYALLSVAGERGTKDSILETLRIPEAAEVRLQRVWTKRTFAEPALRKELREVIARARASISL